MKKIGIILTLVLSAQAWATTCADELVADCKAFKMVGRTCVTLNGDNKVSGSIETLYAEYPQSLFHGPREVELKPVGPIFHGTVTPKLDVYVYVNSQNQYSWDSINMNFGRRTDQVQCSTPTAAN